MSHTAISHEELVRPTHHILLSPHYDDIALSAGGVTRLLALAGHTPQIALLFGSEPVLPLTPFAEEMHRGWGLDASTVISGRRAEEAAASKILGAEDVYLPFHDAIYRADYYTSNDLLFSAPHASEASLPDQIIAALNLPEEASADYRIYAPLGIGFHVDHQNVFRAAQKLAAAGWDVWLYEDLPYAINAGATDTRINRLEGAVIPGPAADISTVWAAKIDAIMCFPSQLPTIFGYIGIGHTRHDIDEALSKYAKASSGTQAERFWLCV